MFDVACLSMEEKIESPSPLKSVIVLLLTPLRLHVKHDELRNKSELCFKMMLKTFY